MKAFQWPPSSLWGGKFLVPHLVRALESRTHWRLAGQGTEQVLDGRKEIANDSRKKLARMAWRGVARPRVKPATGGAGRGVACLDTMESTRPSHQVHALEMHQDAAWSFTFIVLCLPGPYRVQSGGLTNKDAQCQGQAGGQ